MDEFGSSSGERPALRARAAPFRAPRLFRFGSGFPFGSSSPHARRLLRPGLARLGPAPRPSLSPCARVAQPAAGADRLAGRIKETRGVCASSTFGSDWVGEVEMAAEAATLPGCGCKGIRSCLRCEQARGPVDLCPKLQRVSECLCKVSKDKQRPLENNTNKWTRCNLRRSLNHHRD